MNTSVNEKKERVKQKAYIAFEEGYNDLADNFPSEGKMIYDEGVEYYATIDKYKTLRIIIDNTDELFLEEKHTAILIKIAEPSIEESDGPFLDDTDFQQLKEKAIQVACDCPKPRCDVWIIQHNEWDYPVEMSNDKLLIYIENIPMSLVVDLPIIGDRRNG